MGNQAEGARSFRQEFLTALQAGTDYDALLELVRRHKAQGLSVDDAEQVLHQLWLEYGFNKECQPSTLQDDLEAVMEKVWYGFPV